MVGGGDEVATDDAGEAAAAVGDDVDDDPGRVAQQYLVAGIAQLQQRRRIAPQGEVGQIGHGGVGIDDFEVGVVAEGGEEAGGGGGDDQGAAGVGGSRPGTGARLRSR